MLGAGLLGVFSLITGFIKQKIAIFVLRALAGTAAAFSLPSSLTLLVRLFPGDAEKARAVQNLFNETLGTGLWREDPEILAWFGDLELLAPGLVPLPEWRPDNAGQAIRDSTYHGFVGGLARKPQHPA